MKFFVLDVFFQLGLELFSSPCMQLSRVSDADITIFTHDPATVAGA